MGMYALSSKGNDLGEQNIILDASVSKIVSGDMSGKNLPTLLAVSKKWERSMTQPVQWPIWLTDSYSVSKKKILTN